MSLRHLFPALWLVVVALAPHPASAAVIGQIDTFENGTTQNWTVNLLGMGTPVLPANVPDGGPGGAGDNYLLLTSTGTSGGGGRLTVVNPAQWAGDYLAAGIGAIQMDVRNFSAVDLSLRLLFENPHNAPPTDVAFTAPVIVPAMSNWTRVQFSIVPQALTAEDGSAVNALQQATILRIFHSVTPEFPGAPIQAQIGIDNIQALQAVPEPATAVLIITGLAVARHVRRTRSGGR